MLSIHIRQLYTVLPGLFFGHLASKKFHNNIQRNVFIAHIIGKIGPDTEGGSNFIAAVILNFAKNVLKQTKIYGCHAVENVNSGKVMIKNGFVPTGYTTVTNFDGTTKKARTYILNF